eukprot:236094-Pyramimonas_sp.AAC.1
MHGTTLLRPPQTPQTPSFTPDRPLLPHYLRLCTRGTTPLRPPQTPSFTPDRPPDALTTARVALSPPLSTAAIAIWRRKTVRGIRRGSVKGL